MTVTVASPFFCQVNLKEQGQLIRQDEFTVFFRKKKCVRRVFLFEDLILFSKTKKTDIGNDVYIYKQSFKVCTCPCSSKGCQNLNSQPFLNLKTQFTRNYMSMLLESSRMRNFYISFYFLPQTNDIGMTHNSAMSALCFEIWFRRRKSEDTYTLRASSVEVKKAWTTDLERILWDQAAHSRGCDNILSLFSI